MKQIAIIFSFLILLLPISIAETQVFSGKVITGTDKIIDNKIFRFTYDDISNKTFIYNPMQNLIVEKGKCNSNNIYKICINDASYYDKNITTYVFYYQLDVTVYKLTGSLSTASKAASSILLPRESTDFTITITNPTDFDINNIKYMQDLSPFSILEVKGCARDGSQLSWQGSLNSKYSQTCTAKIAAEKGGSYSLAGSLNYFNSYEFENKSTDVVAITVLPKQLKLTKIADQNVEVRQPFYINVTLQNINNNERIELHETVELPENMALLKDVEGFFKESNALKLNSMLNPSSTISYSLYLKSSSESTAPLKDEIDYVIKGISDTIRNDTFVNPKEPKPIINLSSESYTLTPGQKFIVGAKLTNPSRIHQLTDIKAKLNVPYNDQVEQTLDKLLPGDFYSIISNTFIIPENSVIGDGNKTVMLNLTVEYKFYEAVKSLSKSLELKIKQANASSAAATKNLSQAAPETKPKDVAVSKTQSGNKTKIEVTAITEKQKQSFFNKNVIVLITSIFITFILVVFIINRIRKRKKTDTNLEEKALNEISDAINK